MHVVNLDPAAEVFTYPVDLGMDLFCSVELLICIVIFNPFSLYLYLNLLYPYLREGVSGSVVQSPPPPPHTHTRTTPRLSFHTIIFNNRRFMTHLIFRFCLYPIAYGILLLTANHSQNVPEIDFSAIVIVRHMMQSIPFNGF